MDWTYGITLLAVFLMAANKAGFGGGLGHLSMPLMVFAMPAREAVAVMLPLLVFIDILCLAYFWRGWHVRNVVTLVAGCVVGIGVGSLILGLIDDTTLRRIIGALALGYGALQLPHARAFRDRHLLSPKWQTGVLAGIAAGVTSTLVHLGGVITSMFLLPQRLTNREFVGTTTLLYFVVNATKFIPYTWLGLLTPAEYARGLPLVPGAVAGALVGFWLNRRTPAAWFQWIVFGCIVVAGLTLLR